MYCVTSPYMSVTMLQLVSRSLQAFWVGSSSLLILAVAASLTLVAADCDIPAIYNFGDSNSDTGSYYAAFGGVAYPYGITLGRPSGRFADGRLIVDFMAEKLGLPYLSSYVDALEGNFRHGANFAAAGATIQPVDGELYVRHADPLAFNIQLVQFQQLKERTDWLSEKTTSWSIKSRLPRTNEFSKALYTFDIGQNDITFRLRTLSMTADEVFLSLPELIEYLGSAIQQLHQLGARRFWIHNTGPLGCLPANVAIPNTTSVDEIGCFKPYNEVAEEFNRLLKEKVSKLRAQLQDSLLVYVDIYSAKYSLIKDADKHGFVDPFSWCCKDCAQSFSEYWDEQMVNQNVTHPTPCSNRSEYISWDNVHYTEAANRWIANRILDGSFSDPPMPVTAACEKTSSRRMSEILRNRGFSA